MFGSSRWGSKAGASGWPIAMALAMTLTACSSGDESISTTTPCSDMEFAAAVPTPLAAGDIFVQKAGTIFSSCSSIDIQVVVNDLTDIWTVGFDLTYPDTLVSYQGFDLGELLQEGNPVPAPVAFVSEPSPGSLKVTATRFAPAPSVDAVGPKLLITLHFSRLAVGDGMIEFDLSGGGVNNVIQDESGNVRPADFGPPTHGGLLTVLP